MSNLSEEEIKEALERLEYFEPDDLIECAMYRNCIEKLQNLIDLYNKEKEKNKELQEGLKYRVNYCKLLEKELYSNGVNYDMELTKIEEKYLQELLEEE